MKKLIAFILICLILAGGSACESRPPDGPSEFNGRFSVTANPTKIITEGGVKKIVYSLSVGNESEEVYKNCYATVILNEKMDLYIGTGLTSFQFPKIKITAKSDPDPAEDEATGMEITLNQFLSEAQSMKELGIDYADILELGQNFRVWLRWRGGGAIYNLTSPVIDES